MPLVRSMKLIVLAGFFQCAWSSSEQSSGSAKLCPAGEEVCNERGKSMMQVSSAYTAARSKKKDIPSLFDTADWPEIPVRDLTHAKVQMQCQDLANATAVPLDSTGFASIQSQCCAPVMADFIERLITKDGNAVCNIGSLNGLSSFYDCPGDKSFSELTTDISSSSPAQSGNCAWIKSIQATSCPVMQASCPHFPQVPSPTPSVVGPPAPSGPSAPSNPTPSGTSVTPGPNPAAPPAPPPTTSAPCNALSTAVTTPTTAATTTTTYTTTTTMPTKTTITGNHYLVVDQNNHRVVKCPKNSPGADCVVVAGTGAQGSSLSQLNYPREAVLDADSNCIIADSNNHRIQKCPPSSTAGPACITVAGDGVSGSGPNQVKHPQGISLDASGDYIIADTFNKRVQKCSSTTIISCSTVVNFGSRQPLKAFEDATGNYIVSVMQPYDGVLKCPPGAGNYASCSIIAENQGFYYPETVLIDASGYYIIADSIKRRVQKCSGSPPNAPCTIVAGTGVLGPGAAQFSPHGIDFDADGDYLIADFDNHRVQKCPAESPGADCTTVAGMGTAGAGANQITTPKSVKLIA